MHIKLALRGLALQERAVFHPSAPTAELKALLQQATANEQPMCTYIGSAEVDETYQSFLTEPLCFAVALPDASKIDWVNQTTDWLIPYCEVNHLEQIARSLVMLGDGPIAVRTESLAPCLFDARALFVYFVTPEGTLLVKYRWNERLVGSVSAADIAAERYEPDDYESARCIAMGWPVVGVGQEPALIAMDANPRSDAVAYGT
jgi:hypothetical protein